MDNYKSTEPIQKVTEALDLHILPREKVYCKTYDVQPGSKKSQSKQGAATGDLRKIQTPVIAKSISKQNRLYQCQFCPRTFTSAT